MSMLVGRFVLLNRAGNFPGDAVRRLNVNAQFREFNCVAFDILAGAPADEWKMAAKKDE